jgi:hypothetical protein
MSLVLSFVATTRMNISNHKAWQRYNSILFFLFLTTPYHAPHSFDRTQGIYQFQKTKVIQAAKKEPRFHSLTDPTEDKQLGLEPCQVAPS